VTREGREVVGRDAELGVLTTLLDALPEHGGAIVIVGEAGIGKSALLSAVAARAEHRGVRVLGAAGVPSSSFPPFSCLHSLLSPVLDQARGLPDVQRNALLAAFGDGGGPAPEPFLIALATLNLVTEAAARQPVLIAADDVQWFDQPSQAVLSFLVRRIMDDPVVVIGAVRTGHSTPLLTAGVPELEVTGLDDARARGLLAANAADLSPADRDKVLRSAVGNPLALIELPAAIRARGDAPPNDDSAVVPLTDRLEEAFIGRYAELSQIGRDILLTAAVDFTDELVEILAAASALGGHSPTADDLAPAIAAALVRIDGPRLVFRHPLTRSGVLHAEDPGRRRAAHAALASVLGAEPYRRTWHRAQAIIGADDEVADELEAGHRAALHRGSALTAIEALERSAQLTGDPGVRVRRLLLAAEHAFGLGRADLVDRLVSAASREQLSDLEQAKAEWLREMFTDGTPGDAERVLHMCGMARRASAAGDPELALNLLLGAALRCWWADTGPKARAEVVRAADQVDVAADDPRLIAILGVAEPVLRGRTVVERLARADIGPSAGADPLRLLGMAGLAVGDLVRAVQILERAETALRVQGRLGLLPQLLGMLSAVRIELGYWDRVPLATDEGRRIAEETGQPVWNDGALVNDARAAGLRGDPEEALALADRFEHTTALAALDDLRACAQLARGYAFMSAGRLPEAYEALRSLFDPRGRYYDQRECFAGLSLLAEAAIATDRRDDAREVLAEMERVGAITASPLLHVHLRHARAVLADDADAEPLYRAALDADLAGWPWPKARIAFAYGTWLRRQRRLAESREALRAAHQAFELIGATSWAGQCRQMLRAAGERAALAGKSGPTGKDSLTPQELQIAELAAAGMSNREIGLRLFMSHRTVGSHLYRIFPKLGITSRSQLAGALDG